MIVHDANPPGDCFILTSQCPIYENVVPRFGPEDRGGSSWKRRDAVDHVFKMSAEVCVDGVYRPKQNTVVYYNTAVDFAVSFDAWSHGTIYYDAYILKN